jgi:hypothetical protein
MKKIISLVVLLVSMIGTASAENNLSTSIVDGRLSISMTNDVIITAYDFHLYLPEGATIAQKWNEDDEEWVNDVTVSRTKSDHALTLMTDKTDGSFLIGVASPTSKTIKDSSGEIINAGLDLTNVADGTYQCYLKKIWFAISGTQGVEVNDVAFTLEVKGGAIVTGIKDVNAADGVAKGTFKYVDKNGNLVIKTANGNEFNAVGGRTK